MKKIIITMALMLIMYLTLSFILWDIAWILKIKEWKVVERTFFLFISIFLIAGSYAIAEEIEKDF